VSDEAKSTEEKLSMVSSEADGLRDELAAARQTVEEKQQEADAKQKEAEALEQQIGEFEGKIGALNDQLAELAQSRDEARANMNDMRTQLGNAEGLLEGARAEIDQLMAVKLSNEDKLRAASVQAAGVRDSISEQLAASDIDNAEVFIREDNSIGIRVASGRLFRTGSASLSDEGESVLGVVGGIVDGYPEYDIRVEGHTDNVPIGPVLAKTYKSNWELSVARAASAVRYMSSNSGIAAERLSATGYGEYNPIADNSTDEGKEQNRRVEVVLHQQ